MGDFVISPSAEELEAFLGQMLVPSTETLKQQTKFFKQYLKQSNCVLELLMRIELSPNPSIRQLAAVYLRKVMQKHWKSIAPEAQGQVKLGLLELLMRESEALVKRNIANVIVALSDLALALWPELLNLVNQLATAETQAEKELGLYLLSEMLECAGTCSFMQPHLENLRSLFLARLTDETSLAIRKFAMKCIGNLVLHSPANLAGFDMPGLLPYIFNILEQCISDNDDETVTFGMDVFSSMLKLDSVIPLLVKFAAEKVFANSELEVYTRGSGADFVDDVVVGRTKVIQGNLEMLNWVIRVALQVACEEEEAYLTKEDTPTDVAMRLLDTISTEIPSKIIFQPLMAAIGEYRNEADANRRKAAVLALGIISEGCAEPMKKKLAEVVPNIISAFSDPEDAVK